MYPLKFHPILKERLWGGTKLKDKLHKNISSDTTGESWELSGVDGDISVVSNGEFEGTSLNELIAKRPVELLGKSVYGRFGASFPILIKFIDAKKDLSIQLHPDDELAKKRHNSFGKTEMWYVMDADADAELIIGFNRDVSQNEFIESLQNNTLTDLLNYERVSEGDTFFINTGKVHAIGAGVLLAEIQQTSDVTYRIFDFNRRDKYGNLRELHTDLALEAIDYVEKADFRVDYDSTENKLNTMVESPYFKTDYLKLEEAWRQDISERDSFTILICVSGSASVANEFGTVALAKGETVLVPAVSQRLAITTDKAVFLQVSL